MCLYGRNTVSLDARDTLRSHETFPHKLPSKAIADSILPTAAWTSETLRTRTRPVRTCRDVDSTYVPGSLFMIRSLCKKPHSEAIAHDTQRERRDM